MPYVRCPGCRLTTYCVRGALIRTDCPGCGTALAPRGGARATWSGMPNGLRAARPVPETIDRALSLALHELGMDVSFLSEVSADREEIVRCAGDIGAFGLEDGLSVALDDTYCKMLLEGTIDGVIRDAKNDERVRHLEATGSRGIGAYIGVPISSWNARVYVLCCLAREARPSLSDADVRFLRGLSESVAAHLPLAVPGAAR